MIKHNAASNICWPDRVKVGITPALIPSLLIGFSLMSVLTFAQAACEVDPSAWVLDSTFQCEENPFNLNVTVGPNARVVGSTLLAGSNIGARTQVLNSSLSNVRIGADSHVVAAQFGAPELSVTLGTGAVIDRGANLLAAIIGDNAQIGSEARVSGGRGIDQVFIGDNFVLGKRAEVRMRQLGDNADIGVDAVIGESTEAGNNLEFGARSVWVVGGTMGNDVSIGNNVMIEGGVNIDSGATVGSNVEIGFLVSIGANAKVSVGSLLGNSSIVGANALLDRRVVLGSGATVGEGVLLGRRVQVGDNAMIGAGSIVDARAVIAVGAQIPPNSFVASDGSVSGSAF